MTRAYLLTTSSGGLLCNLYSRSVLLLPLSVLSTPSPSCSFLPSFPINFRLELMTGSSKVSVGKCTLGMWSTLISMVFSRSLFTCDGNIHQHSSCTSGDAHLIHHVIHHLIHHTCSVADVYLLFQGSIESYLLSKRNARIKEKLEERQMLAARSTGLILRCVVL